MCVVSNVGDHYTDRWRPYTQPVVYPGVGTGIGSAQSINISPISRTEFDLLKREVAEMKELLKAAKTIDTALGTPDCEQEEKLAVLRAVAKLVGVDLEDVLG